VVCPRMPKSSFARVTPVTSIKDKLQHQLPLQLYREL
jgi:hypothetical protein